MSSITRRVFLKYVAAAGATGAAFVLAGPGNTGRAIAAERTRVPAAAARAANRRRKAARRNAAVRQALPGGTLDPPSIPKFVTPLLIPPVMPKSGRSQAEGRQERRLLRDRDASSSSSRSCPRRCPTTTVWGYGPYGNGATFNAPSLTIEAQLEQASAGQVDQQPDRPQYEGLPAAPAARSTRRCTGRTRPGRATCTSGTNPEPYTGPVPMVTHVHGAHVERRERRLRRGLVPAAGEQHPDGLRHRGHVVQPLQGASSRPSTAQPWTPGLAGRAVPQRPGRHDALVPRPHARHDAR